jgi:hypothetical protein
MKNFFASKINWSALIIIFIALQDFIQNWDFSAMTVKSWVLFVLGILIVVFRTFFTSKTIAQVK